MGRLGGLVVAGAFIASAGWFTWDIRAAHRRVEGRSRVIESPSGTIEYTDRRSGLSVLVLHGSGGGYDQGELVASAALGDDFRCIAPSRFGYLRSTFHPGATFDDQAHAYAHLLDALELKQVAVVTLSHGGPSALLFAALYPDRVSSLTLISAGVHSSTAAEQREANQKGDALTMIFAHDWLYWGATKAFRGQLLNLMGASDQVVDRLDRDQRRLVDELIDWMNPVSLRSVGVAFDNHATMPNERIALIRAPTLVLHARDDGLQLFHNAEFAAANIPGARLVSFDRGGHLLLATERERVRALVQAHIRAHASALPQ
jgi:2-hydroxy-6-oxonona-2,4-dienedioate hydrolase